MYCFQLLLSNSTCAATPRQRRGALATRRGPVHRPAVRPRDRVCGGDRGRLHVGSGHGGSRRPPGRTVQVDPVNPRLKLPRTKRLILVCDIILSTSAFKFNSRRYTPDVLAGVVHWLQKMGMGQNNIGAKLDALRKEAVEGAQYCFNEGCEVMGHLKDFKVCPQCKTHRYRFMRVRNKTGQWGGTRRRVARHSNSTHPNRRRAYVCKPV